jgi:hypothetical protein
MTDEASVRIAEWPTDAAQLEHRFDPERPVPVSLRFDEDTANVALRSDQPIALDMRLAAREDIPLCIKICEPICARSEYTIGIDIFDRPVALVTIRGTTKLFECDDKR